MKHAIRIIEIQHLSKNGEVLWEQKNLKNILHTEGEEFLLSAAFIGGKTSNTYIPTSYYFGLDNRATLAAADTMATVASNGEPSTNGYARSSVSSLSQFTISTNISGYNTATSPIVGFTASGGSWGPVRNLFLTDKSDNSGYLIASVALTTPKTVMAGEAIHARMGLELKDCP
jgi:hypothetical protein